MIEGSKIPKYSIHLQKVETDRFYLFTHFEHAADDFEADVAKMGKDKTTKMSCNHTDDLQSPIPRRNKTSSGLRLKERVTGNSFSPKRGNTSLAVYRR